MLRQGAFPEGTNSEQDALLWSLIGSTFGAYYQGTFTQANGFQFFMAWKGTTNLLGWQGLSLALSPPARGPFAYVLGSRFQHVHKKPDQAASFYRTARTDAPPGSPLEKLAQEALERVTTKP
jgi:hypothetical protein